MTFPASRVGFAVHHARGGERVLMIVPEGKAIPQVLTMIAHFGLRAGEQLTRSRGLEGFRTTSGGSIRFLTERGVPNGSRGARAELVLVDADVAWTDQLGESLKLCAAKIHREEG